MNHCGSSAGSEQKGLCSSNWSSGLRSGPQLNNKYDILLPFTSVLMH